MQRITWVTFHYYYFIFSLRILFALPFVFHKIWAKILLILRRVYCCSHSHPITIIIIEYLYYYSREERKMYEKREKYIVYCTVSIFLFLSSLFFQTLSLLAFQCLPPSSSTATLYFPFHFSAYFISPCCILTNLCVFHVFFFLFPLSSIHGFASLLLSFASSPRSFSPSCLFLLSFD